MLERNFERQVVKKLRELPRSWIPDKSVPGSNRGQPDILGCVNGITIGLELKRNKKEAMKKTGRIVLQRYILNEMFVAGAFADIVYPENFEDIYKQLKEFCGVE